MTLWGIFLYLQQTYNQIIILLCYSVSLCTTYPLNAYENIPLSRGAYKCSLPDKDHTHISHYPYNLGNWRALWTESPSPPQPHSYIWSPNSQCDCIWRLDLWDVKLNENIMGQGRRVQKGWCPYKRYQISLCPPPAPFSSPHKHTERPC